jgi:hypothetical protein
MSIGDRNMKNSIKRNTVLEVFDKLSPPSREYIADLSQKLLEIHRETPQYRSALILEGKKQSGSSLRGRDNAES